METDVASEENEGILNWPILNRLNASLDTLAPFHVTVCSYAPTIAMIKVSFFKHRPVLLGQHFDDLLDAAMPQPRLLNLATDLLKASTILTENMHRLPLSLGALFKGP